MPQSTAPSVKGLKARATLAWGEAPGHRTITTCGLKARSIPAWDKAPGIGSTTSLGLKARSIPAWGEAPGLRQDRNRGLKARPIHSSIPNVPFVALHPISLEKRTKFFLKRTLPMVRFLTIDVLNQSLQIRRPNGERTVPSLPRELRQTRRLGLKPFGRTGLQLLHQLRHAQRPVQTNSEMHMIRNTTDPITFTPSIARNGGKVSIERETHRSVKNRRAILRTEDHVDEKKRERLRHCRDYRSGLQPSVTVGNITWGFTPCWYKAAPSALSTSTHVPRKAPCSTHS